MNGRRAKFSRWVAREITGRPVTQRIYQFLEVPTRRSKFVEANSLGLPVLDDNGNTISIKKAIRVRLKPGCPREVYQRVKKDVPVNRAA